MGIKQIISKQAGIIAVIAIIVGFFVGSRLFSSAKPDPDQLTASLIGGEENQITAADGGIRATAVRIVDGDTIDLDSGKRLRYTGIDAPEGAYPGQDPECYSKEALEKNKELVEGKEIRIVRDVSEQDPLGRLLGYVYVGDIFVNEELVKQGAAFATPYPPDTAHQNTFAAAETSAMEQNVGLWGACNYGAENRPIPD
jgi:micrococcal nuclease